MSMTIENIQLANKIIELMKFNDEVIDNLTKIASCLYNGADAFTLRLMVNRERKEEITVPYEHIFGFAIPLCTCQNDAEKRHNGVLITQDVISDKVMLKLVDVMLLEKRKEQRQLSRDLKELGITK